jgi:L-lactate dehydrogenase complex protein LldG
MSEARGRILADIRRSLRRGPLDPATRAQLEAEIAAHRRNLVPQRGALDDAARVDLFIAMAQEVQSTVRRVGSTAEVPAAVADYLAGENLAAEFVMAPEPSLDAIPWAIRPLLRVRRGRPTPDDKTSVTPAFAAIAETGTLLLVSGPETPTTLNFLAETHVVILRAERIVGSYEDAWDRLRAGRTLPNRLPRAVNFITGPSRTADIEQQIVQGMHGPRRLHIVLIDPLPAVSDADSPG